MADKKILLVEDESIEAMDIKRTLEFFGYEVPYVSSSGEEVVEKAYEIMPDLILMDVVLTGNSDGIDVASKIKKLNIPVIYLTAHSEESIIQRAKLTEPYGYMIKPYDRAELKYAIELALYKNKIENELKESEYNLRLILDSTAEGIFGIDLEGLCTFCNASSLDLWGYDDLDELIGKNIHDLIHPMANCPIDDTFKSGKRVHVEDDVFWRADGTSFSAEYWSYPQIKDQKIVGAVVTFTDITERRQAELEIKKSLDEKEILLREREKAEIALKGELKVNKSIAKVYGPLISPYSPIEDVTNVILDESKMLTGSENGVVSTIDPITRETICHTLTNMMDHCKLENENLKIRFPLGPDGKYPGLGGHSLNTRQAFFTNTPSEHKSFQGTPPGHTPLKRFLSVPILLEKELVGQINLANPGKDYTETDLEAIQRLGESYAMAIQKIRAEEQMKSSLREKEVLLREIHHRVKNNLQIIASLLHLQEGSVDEKEVADVLKESESRVKSMVMVHEKLYESPNFTDINFKEYIEKLVYDILYTYGIKIGIIKVQLDIEDTNLNIDTAIPLGLIINELITNTVKYAFPQNEGTITLKLKSLPENMEITIADNGIGLPKDFDLENPETLGLQLVQSLVNQLEGKLKLNNDNGTEFKITFKELKYKKRL
jgi:PAS domain S-box-containing protein